MRTALDFGGGLGFAVFHCGSASPARAGPPGQMPAGQAPWPRHRQPSRPWSLLPGRSAMTPLAGGHYG